MSLARIFLVFLLSIAGSASAQIISIRQTYDGKVLATPATEVTIPDTIEAPVIRDTVFLSFRSGSYQDSTWYSPRPVDKHLLSFSSSGWHAYTSGFSREYIPYRKVKTGRRSFRLDYSYNATVCGPFVWGSRYETYFFDRQHRLSRIKQGAYKRDSNLVVPAAFSQEQTFFYDKSGKLSRIRDQAFNGDTLLPGLTANQFYFYDEQKRLKYIVTLEGEKRITLAACDSLMSAVWTFAALPDSLRYNALETRYRQLIDACGYKIVGMYFYHYENDRLVSAWDIHGHPVVRDSLIYDNEGRLSIHAVDRIHQPFGARMEFHYDSLTWKLSGVRTWQPHSANYKEERYQYDAAGRMEFILIPDTKKIMRRSIRFVYPERKPGETK